MLAKISINGEDMGDFKVINRDLKFKRKYYVGTRNNLRDKICANIHGTFELGHSGIFTSIRRAELYFYWPSLRVYFTNYVKECETCQRNKTEHVPIPGLL